MPKRSCKKRHTLVVGGTRGIGRAIVKKLHDENYVVSVISKNYPQEKIKISNVDYWEADITGEDEIADALKEIVKKNKKLNNLVLCQQFRGEGDSWEGHIETHLKATRDIIELSKDKIKIMEKSSITVIGSTANEYICEEQSVGYHVAKSGLVQLVRYYALELAPKVVRVNCVSPSTMVKEESKKFYLQNKELHDLYKKVAPFGNMLTAEDVANVVMFFCSPDSSSITGQNIVVDGGISLQWHEGLARKLSSLDNLEITRRDNKT
ncbi:MAG: SDR family oxidoreductase [Candidatus Brocadiaceae bacterium]|nr:SDR family oxidoreductase [Candidatus Brocadiaceae bacterium]